MNDDDIRNGYRKHGALAQLYRWWQWYEHADSPLENQLDIMTADIVINSASGLAESRDAYGEIAASFPVMKNAHVPDAIDVTPGDDGVVGTADITYTNLGAQPDGSLTALKIHYDLELTEQPDSPLPLFRSIVITVAGPAENETEFRDAYPVSRARSLAHYYHALLESPGRTIEPFAEIFADDLHLGFGAEPLTSLDDFNRFLEGAPSTVEASYHLITAFDAVGNDDGTITATIDFDWFGILPDGTRMEASTRHTWQVDDDPTARFAKLRRADVETLRPFTKVDT